MTAEDNSKSGARAETNARPRAEALFFAALERPKDERASWLREASGGDPALESEVTSLLAALERASAGEKGFLEQPIVQIADAGRVAARALIGHRVGDFTPRAQRGAI